MAQVLQTLVSLFFAFLGLGGIFTEPPFWVVGIFGLLAAIILSPPVVSRWPSHFLKSIPGYSALACGMFVLIFGAEAILLYNQPERQAQIASKSSPSPTAHPSQHSLKKSPIPMTPAPTTERPAAAASAQPSLATPKVTVTPSAQTSTMSGLSPADEESIYREIKVLAEQHNQLLDKQPGLTIQERARLVEEEDKRIEQQITKKYGLTQDQYIQIIVSGEL